MITWKCVLNLYISLLFKIEMKKLLDTEHGRCTKSMYWSSYTKNQSSTHLIKKLSLAEYLLKIVLPKRKYYCYFRPKKNTFFHLRIKKIQLCSCYFSKSQEKCFLKSEVKIQGFKNASSFLWWNLYTCALKWLFVLKIPQWKANYYFKKCFSEWTKDDLHLNHLGFLLEMWILCPNPGLPNQNQGKGSPICNLHSTLL